MVEAVSAGTLAAVEELATSPPAKRTPSIFAAAEEGAVGLVSVSLDSTVIGVEAIYLFLGSCGGMSTGTGVRGLDLLSAFPRPGLPCVS